MPQRYVKHLYIQTETDILHNATQKKQFYMPTPKFEYMNEKRVIV